MVFNKSSSKNLWFCQKKLWFGPCLKELIKPNWTTATRRVGISALFCDTCLCFGQKIRKSKLQRFSLIAVFLAFMALRLKLLGAVEFLYQNQSHYREVPGWGVSNGARHNWKCFLTYIFFLNFHIFFIHQNVQQIISFHLRYMMVS